MDVDLGTIIAGLVGGLAGSIATLIGVFVQHHFELVRDRLKEARARTVVAAERCLALVSAISSAIEMIEYGADHKYRKMLADASESRIHDSNGELFEQLAFLPSELRARINSARVIMVFAKELADGGFHYLTRSPIAKNAAHEAQEALAAFLRHDEVPESSPRFRELQAAFADMEETWQGRPDDERRAEHKRREEEFKRKHPELFSDAAPAKRRRWKVRIQER